MFANFDTSWEEALKYTQEMSAEIVANEAAMKNCIGSFAGSLKDLYFLVVLAGKVQDLLKEFGFLITARTSPTENHARPLVGFLWCGTAYEFLAGEILSSSSYC